MIYRVLTFMFFLQGLIASDVVLVTGASKGIGFATVERLVEEGYTVYAGVRNRSQCTPLHALQNLNPDLLSIIPLDVTDQLEVDRAIEEILAEQGHLDVLINNAGILKYGFMENHTIDEAKELFDVNFFGVMRVTNAVLPVMRDQNSGRIIQITSRSGFRPVPSISLYSATKGALENLSETLAATLKPWSIHVSMIEPGPVKTGIDMRSPYASRLSPDKDPYWEIFNKVGLLKLSPSAQKPEEIASLVLQAMRDEKPNFRYQTTRAIEKQAAKRLYDITGNSSVKEWVDFLYHVR